MRGVQIKAIRIKNLHNALFIISKNLNKKYPQNDTEISTLAGKHYCCLMGSDDDYLKLQNKLCKKKKFTAIPLNCSIAIQSDHLL